MYVVGKRKRRIDQNKTPPPPPAFMPYSSRMDSLSKEKSCHPVGTSAVKPMSSLMDVMESSVKPPSGHHPHSHHRHHNLSHSLLLRLPRHYYGLQYSQRNSSTNHAGSTSSFHGKTTPLHNEKLTLKLSRKSESVSGRHSERREKASRRPDRIRSSSLGVEAVSPDVVKMVCGLCQKLLKRKSPCILESTFSSSDLSAVAVLVCGHVYHADCLETRTCYEDRRDPPCPLCVTMNPVVGS